MYTYKILNFDRSTGTFVIEFLDGMVPILNYNAPRSNGVYLSGQALEDHIQSLRKPDEERTMEEWNLMLVIPADDPATITGGEDIDAKVAINTSSE